MHNCKGCQDKEKESEKLREELRRKDEELRRKDEEQRRKDEERRREDEQRAKNQDERLRLIAELREQNKKSAAIDAAMRSLWRK